MQKIEDVYQQYANTVYRYLLYLTKNKELAEDLTQETFAVAVKRIGKFRGECKISVWLCQIAKYLWYKELKKKEKKKTFSLEELSQVVPQDDMLEEKISEKEEKLSLYQKIETLSEQEKSIMYLRLAGDLNFVEIAQVLGKSPNWVRVTFYRAKEKLKKGGRKDGKKGV